ncbi:serine/threonine kinase 3, partial [Caulochytrium protostelioides]
MPATQGDGKPFLTEEELNKDPEAVFHILEKVGEGSYGQVVKAMHLRTSTVCAIKMIPIENDLNESIKEISMMMGCDSNYVVNFFGSYLKDEQLWIVMEYCGAGSVSDIMNLTRRTLSEDQIATICVMVLRGLVYLHERRKIHRDIKAANILLTEDGRVRLCDFGVAGQISLSCLRRTSFVGTPYWMPPEIIQRSHYDTKADIWSLGITMIELAKGNPPFADQDPRRAIFLIPRSPPARLEEKLFSPALREFVALCLQTNPDLRPTAEELLKTKLVRGASRDPMALQDLLRRHQAW